MSEPSNSSTVVLMLLVCSVNIVPAKMTNDTKIETMQDVLLAAPQATRCEKGQTVDATQAFKHEPIPGAVTS